MPGSIPNSRRNALVAEDGDARAGLITPWAPLSPLSPVSTGNRHRFGQGLGSRCYVGHLAKYLAGRVDHTPQSAPPENGPPISAKHRPLNLPANVDDVR